MFYFLFQAQNEVFGAAVAEIASQQQLYPQTGNQSQYIYMNHLSSYLYYSHSGRDRVVISKNLIVYETKINISRILFLSVLVI